MGLKDSSRTLRRNEIHQAILIHQSDLDSCCRSPFGHPICYLLSFESCWYDSNMTFLRVGGTCHQQSNGFAKSLSESGKLSRVARVDNAAFALRNQRLLVKLSDNVSETRFQCHPNRLVSSWYVPPYEVVPSGWVSFRPFAARVVFKSCLFPCSPSGCSSTVEAPCSNRYIANAIITAPSVKCFSCPSWQNEHRFGGGSRRSIYPRILVLVQSVFAGMQAFLPICL